LPVTERAALREEKGSCPELAVTKNGKLVYYSSDDIPKGLKFAIFPLKI
jgi:hypothetical protein